MKKLTLYSLSLLLSNELYASGVESGVNVGWNKFTGLLILSSAFALFVFGFIKERAALSETRSKIKAMEHSEPVLKEFFTLRKQLFKSFRNILRMVFILVFFIVAITAILIAMFS